MFYLPGEPVLSNNAEINLYSSAGSYCTLHICCHCFVEGFYMFLRSSVGLFHVFLHSMLCQGFFHQVGLIANMFWIFFSCSFHSQVLFFTSFPAIVSLISSSVSCKLFEPWMELNGFFVSNFRSFCVNCIYCIIVWSYLHSFFIF